MIRICLGEEDLDIDDPGREGVMKLFTIVHRREEMSYLCFR